MTILLLLLIYLVFISLGLPDSLLGSSFPAIAENLAISVDHAGYIGMTVSLFTILSSAFSDKLVEKWNSLLQAVRNCDNTKKRCTGSNTWQRQTQQNEK